MESLFNTMTRLLHLTSMDIVRDYMNKIKWSKRLVAIIGARGVGKTTLMLQYVKKTYVAGSRKVLYCSLEDLYFGSHTIVQLAEEFYLQGGETLLLDEVHKYTGWSREIKIIYDSFPSLRVVISGSSMIDLMNANTDLSRRVFPYTMQGLSFREFLRFYHGLEIPCYSIEELLQNASAICEKLNERFRPLPLFKKYNEAGYYPFFDGDKEDYYMHITNVVNYIIYQELPSLCGVDVAYARKIKALISVIANSNPFEVDITRLSRLAEMARTTILDYLQKLEKAGLLTLLYSDLISVKKMQKPDKIYLQNPNLLEAFALRNAAVGTVRETFALLHLKEAGEVEYGKDSGDFVLDGRYVFEVGGADKGFSQIADIPDSYVLADNIEYPSGHKLPLWLIGLLY